MKRTSRSILRRCNRLDRLDILVDTEGRSIRAGLVAGYLTYDAERHNLDVAFRADGAGSLHVYSTHGPSSDGLDIVSAVERGSIPKRLFPDCDTTRYLAELLRDCGPNLRNLEEVATRLRRNMNSEIRGELRKRDKTKRGAAEEAERRAIEKSRAETVDMMRTINEPRWHPGWGPRWDRVRIDCDLDNWRNNEMPFSLNSDDLRRILEERPAVIEDVAKPIHQGDQMIYTINTAASASDSTAWHQKHAPSTARPLVWLERDKWGSWKLKDLRPQDDATDQA